MARQGAVFGGDEIKRMRKRDYRGAEVALCKIRDGVLRRFQEQGPRFDVSFQACPFGRSAFDITWAYAMFGPPAATPQEAARRPQIGLYLWNGFGGFTDRYCAAFRLAGPETTDGRLLCLPEATKLFLDEKAAEMTAFAKADRNRLQYCVTHLYADESRRSPGFSCPPTSSFQAVKDACGGPPSYRARYNAINLGLDRSFSDVAKASEASLVGEAYKVLSRIAERFRGILESGGY